MRQEGIRFSSCQLWISNSANRNTNVRLEWQYMNRACETRRATMTEILTCHFRRVIASLFAIVVSVMISGTAVAGDACKNIKFKVTNKHDSGETILIKKVKYFNKANGKWQTEVVN